MISSNPSPLNRFMMKLTLVRSLGAGVCACMRVRPVCVHV